VRKSEIVAAPCAFRKLAETKMYPTKSPAAQFDTGNNWLKRATYVAPAGTVPSDAIPKPGRFVELVVKVHAVPAPVAVAGKKSNFRVPAEAAAPPPPEPNGSDVVFAIEIPVSNTPTFSAKGINRVVLAGTMLTTVTGVVSAWANVG
jgi:hypothetical protein